MDTNVESITLQEEEVQWGSFIPYNDIVHEASLSIQRLRNNNQWPGTSSSDNEHGSSKERNQIEKIQNWDFVPDGLLVWEAWLKYIEESSS